MTEIKEGCGEACTDCGPGVIYVRAKGDTDTLHYIISAVGGPPAVVVMRTNTPPHIDGGVDINCDALKTENRSEAFTVDPRFKVLYTYGVVFTRVGHSTYLIKSISVCLK